MEDMQTQGSLLNMLPRASLAKLNTLKKTIMLYITMASLYWIGTYVLFYVFTSLFPELFMLKLNQWFWIGNLLIVSTAMVLTWYSMIMYTGKMASPYSGVKLAGGLLTWVIIGACVAVCVWDVIYVVWASVLLDAYYWSIWTSVFRGFEVFFIVVHGIHFFVTAIAAGAILWFNYKLSGLTKINVGGIIKNMAERSDSLLEEDTQGQGFSKL